MLREGQTFGRYVIEALIGEGGMGKVFRAEDTSLRRRVALKVLLLKGGTPSELEESKARMLREARAAAALEHPNVVSIYDIGSVDGTPFIAMELVQGKNLHAFVGDATVPWERRLRWLLDAGSALAAAHEAGLVHRDIKPENVMIRAEGRVKVLDFGIARRASVPGGHDATAPQGGIETITGQGVIIGTLRYMSPEQLAGKPLDGRADQFAWGVMAYELFAGDAPWPAHPDILASVTAILTVTPASLVERAPFLPPPVASAIHRTLSKSPEERFATMGDLLAALEPFAAKGSVPPSGQAGVSSIPVPAPQSLRAIAANAPTVPLPSTGSSMAVDPSRWPPRRSAARAALRGGAAMAAVVAVALGAWLGFRGHIDGRTSASAPAPSASASGARTTLLDLPVPATTVPEAATAYRAGLQALYDASTTAAAGSFLEAATKDPGMAAAHLRYAYNDLFFHTADAHAHFEKASGLRSTLTPHDAALLDAIAPLFDSQPPDWAETEQRLVAASAKAPADVELLHDLAATRYFLGKVTDALASVDAVLAIDPHFAGALATKERILAREGDVDAVVRTSNACLKTAPRAASCLTVRLQTEGIVGRCEDYEQSAKRLIAINPQDATGYDYLGFAALAAGRSSDSVLDIFRTGWRFAGSDADWTEALDRVGTYALWGDALHLEKALDSLEHEAEQQGDAFEHLTAAWFRVEAAAELGSPGGARAASGYLDRAATWQQDPGSDAQTIAFDVVPMMSKALERAGKMSHADFERRRDDWVAGWRTRIGSQLVGYLWMYGYAQTVTTPDEAAQALAVLPEFVPLPEYRLWWIVDAGMGRTYLLGGRPKDAIPLLQRASSRCDPPEDPFVYVYAALWLGEALEAVKRNDEACTAYGKVIQRWSGFGARSVSLRKARARTAALGCPAKGKAPGP